MLSQPYGGRVPRRRPRSLSFSFLCGLSRRNPLGSCCRAEEVAVLNGGCARGTDRPAVNPCGFDADKNQTSEAKVSALQSAITHLPVGYLHVWNFRIHREAQLAVFGQGHL